MTGHKHKQKMHIYIANPRGFCAGVERAIFFVEKVLEKYGPPIYVHHAIVHNNHVVSALESKGVHFVSHIREAPTKYPIVFSAHGTDKHILNQVKHEHRIMYDAVCPLVSRIHRSVERAYLQGFHVIFIGHMGHPEVKGTMSQIPWDRITLIETLDQINQLPSFQQPLAYATQTTLSIMDTQRLIHRLKERFPHIVSPLKMDICYATYNRQKAVMLMIPKVEKILIIGSPESSNSKRLVEIAQHNHVDALLLDDPQDLNFDWLDSVKNLGISSGASAPESFVQKLVDYLKLSKYIEQIQTISFTEEHVKFSIPKDLI